MVKKAVTAETSGYTGADSQEYIPKPDKSEDEIVVFKRQILPVKSRLKRISSRFKIFEVFNSDNKAELILELLTIRRKKSSKLTNSRKISLIYDILLEKFTAVIIHLHIHVTELRKRLLSAIQHSNEDYNADVARLEKETNAAAPVFL